MTDQYTARCHPDVDWRGIKPLGETQAMSEMRAGVERHGAGSRVATRRTPALVSVPVLSVSLVLALEAMAVRELLPEREPIALRNRQANVSTVPDNVPAVPPSPRA